MLPRSESPRVARYRRLQSWYREVQLGAPAGDFRQYRPLDSYLAPEAVLEQPDLNFLHPAAFEHAQTRLAQIQQAGGTLEEGRLLHNLLSSMPLCFNLFGAMRDEPAFLPVFQKLFDSEAAAITEIICAWSPTEPEATIGDRTSFGAIIFYVTESGPRFVAIETKYTEPFSQRAYPVTARQREVANTSGWFTRPAHALKTLPAARSNHLWRSVLLAAALELQGSSGRGSVAVVALGDDVGAEKAVAAVASELTGAHPPRLTSVTIESILDTTDRLAPELSWWTASFRRRYVQYELAEDPKNPGAGRDSSGPVFGRSLAETVLLSRK